MIKGKNPFDICPISAQTITVDLRLNVMVWSFLLIALFMKTGRHVSRLAGKKGYRRFRQANKIQLDSEAQCNLRETVSP